MDIKYLKTVTEIGEVTTGTQSLLQNVISV